jgi:hypothetical protein
MHNRLFSNLNGIWEIPSNVDVSKFDFDWKPSELYDPPFIHVFGTQWQKTGGPRYIVDNSTQVKYVDTQIARRVQCMDNWKLLHKDIDINSFDFSWHPDDTEPEYTYVFGSDYSSPENMPCITYGNGSNLKYMNNIKAKFKPLDIVFMSNGEKGEEDRYKLLSKYANREVKWVRNISGRDNAIRKCVEVSNTEWVLVFPAKLRVYEDFDFNWQPDRSGVKRNFIFYADNLVNNLRYGHMAPVAYNREVVLNTNDYGLDFTMSGAHDIVPISAGIAEFNLDPLMTWRTAFREVIKLKISSDNGDLESSNRLNTWLTVAHGLNAFYSLLGAKDGIEYYEEVNGDINKLKFTFDWVWLNNRFNYSKCVL